MMRTLSLVIFLFAFCQRTLAEDLPVSLLHTVEMHLHINIAAPVPVVLMQQRCVRSETSIVDSAEFRSTYPLGVYLACDAQLLDGIAKITVLHYLFNESFGKPLVAAKIHANSEIVATLGA